MYPKTPYGWYNKIVRGHPYNERTGKLLDFTFKPDPREVNKLNTPLSNDWLTRGEQRKADKTNLSSLLEPFRKRRIKR